MEKVANHRKREKRVATMTKTARAQFRYKHKEELSTFYYHDQLISPQLKIEKCQIPKKCKQWQKLRAKF